MRIGDNLRALYDSVRDVTVRLVLFGAEEQDVLAVQLNGVPLALATRDPDWKDSQILSPEPQRNSGGRVRWPVNPDQELLRLDFTVPPQLCFLGENHISIRLVEHQTAGADEIALEKVEIHVDYAE